MMQVFIAPQRKQWSVITARPAFDASQLFPSVAAVFQAVEEHGDAALLDYTEQFDQVRLSQLRINTSVLEEAVSEVPEKLKTALVTASQNIRTFHEANRPRTAGPVEVQPGVRCWVENRAIERVGLYIPGGSAPLFSTVLMLALPAQLAGCREIVLCTPPDANGEVPPAIRYAAQQAGVTQVFALGGMQAIAAMALGTESVPRVDKIFGPGNAYVTAAKQYAQLRGVAIDLPAGPSELLVLADAQVPPAFVAADLLSQAEHGPDSQVIAVVPDSSLIDPLFEAVETQLKTLPRKNIAQEALAASCIVCLPDAQDRLDFINAYAPEHLILATQNANELAPGIGNAGSVFLGNYSPESAGDYASGTNHTLPTNGSARAYSGVSVADFQRQLTFQEITADGLQDLGPLVEVMAREEQLEAHRQAVSIRLHSLKK